MFISISWKRFVGVVYSFCEQHSMFLFTDLGENTKIETPQIPPMPRIISAAASSSGILSLQVQYIMTSSCLASETDLLL